MFDVILNFFRWLFGVHRLEEFDDYGDLMNLDPRELDYLEELEIETKPIDSENEQTGHLSSQTHPLHRKNE